MGKMEKVENNTNFMDNAPRVNILEYSFNDIDIIKNEDSFALYNKGIRWMTLDLKTNKQIKEFYSQYDMAYGNVMLTGFGFGLLTSWLDSKPNVESITVVEISEDVVKAFLKNNKLSDKVKIVIKDASEYKDVGRYDCLFLDHYETQNDFWFIRDIKRLAANIPNHNLFWAWSMEEKMLNNFYNYEHFEIEEVLKKEDLFIQELYYNFKNNVLGLNTMPDLSPELIKQYIRAYYDRLEYVW